jgi:hypothetical protein
MSSLIPSVVPAYRIRLQTHPTLVRTKSWFFCEIGDSIQSIRQRAAKVIKGPDGNPVDESRLQLSIEETSLEFADRPIESICAPDGVIDIKLIDDPQALATTNAEEGTTTGGTPTPTSQASLPEAPPVQNILPLMRDLALRPRNTYKRPSQDPHPFFGGRRGRSVRRIFVEGKRFRGVRCVGRRDTEGALRSLT